MAQDNSNSEDFMQQPELPEKYGKAQGAGWSIIETLEVIESDFTKNLSTAELDQADAE